jgi:hypothetical protein
MTEAGIGMQYNFRQGEALINAYIPDGDEEDMRDDARMKLRVVSELAAESAATSGLLRATAVAEGLLGASPVSSAATAASGGAGAPGRACEHGPMTPTSGISKKTGKPWKAWDCPAGNPPMGCGRQFVNG